MYGGVSKLTGSRWFANDCRRDGTRTEGGREGGALRTAGLETEVVGLWSFQRREIEGQRRVMREVKLSFRCSPDLRRLIERSPMSSPSPKESSPGNHSALEVGSTAEWVALGTGRCSQKVVSPALVSTRTSYVRMGSRHTYAKWLVR